jgi:F-box-like
MKRTHDGAFRIPPFHVRNTGAITKKQRTLNRTRNVVHELPTRNLISELPLELLIQIFSDLTLTFNAWKKISHVCRSWKAIVYSDQLFGSIILDRAGLKNSLAKKNPNDTWLKPYELWIKTQTFILLDCSDSMKTPSGMKVKELVISKASEVFNNGWIRGVNLGLFATEFHLQNYKSELKLNEFIKSIDTNLDKMRLDTTCSLIIPLLEKVNTQIPMKNKAIKTIIHIMSDCAFDRTDDVSAYVQKLLDKGKNLSINFYHVGDSELAQSFVLKTNNMAANQKENAITRVYYNKIKDEVEV